MLKKSIITTAVFLVIAGFAFRTARADIPASERNTLTDLYSSTGGPGWNDSTGWNDSPGTECGWYGVTCDSQGAHVTRIDLDSNNLEGNLPESLGNLTELSLINLSYNSLSGSIPVSAGNLANLAALDLGVNSLTGNIPPGLGNILSLRYIFLHYNSLTGAVPPELGNLTYLRLLKLGNNELSGSIPPELGNLSSLQYLTLYKNRLEGGIPPEIGNLGNLRELGLQSNMLSGVIPADLAKLANMTPGKSDFRWNALYTEDDSTGIFLGTVQDGGDWESTQTVAPVSLAAGTPGPISVPLSWAGAGLADEYEVVYADVSGGPYTVFGTVTGTETEVTGLAPGTAWYFRIRSVTLPHADNPNTVFSGYSGEVSAVTPGFTLPEVTTADISSVTVSSASGGGNVTADTGVKITARGLCWNTSSVPDTADPADYACTSDGSGTGSFTSAITGLEPGTAYHARAYAVCSAGTVFGNEAVFTTLPDVPVLTVDGPDERTVYNDLIVVTGTVVNTQYTVTAASDRYADMEFAADTADTGRFSCEVPLLDGENLLTFKARNSAGEQAEKYIRVTFLLPIMPTVTITAPADGTTVHTGTVTVSGTVLSNPEPGQITLTLGDRTAVPAGENGEYTFSFENIVLSEGTNILKVVAETAFGTSSDQVSVTCQPDPGDEPPAVEIYSPLPDSFFTENAVVVKGTAGSTSVIESVTVDGEEAVKVPESGIEVFFKHTVYFSQDTDQLQITVTATDSAGRTGSVTINVEYDNTAPVITVVTPGSATAGEVITVEESPFTLVCTVTEKNPAGVSLNSSSVSIMPAGSGIWSFEEEIALAAGEEQPVTVEAWDSAGNRAVLEFIMKLADSAVIEMISPSDGAEYTASGTETEIVLTARVSGAPEGATAEATADNGIPQPVPLNNGLVNGTFVSPAAHGEHELILHIINNDTVIAQARVHYTVTNPDSIPLKLEKQKPANNEKNAEPNAVIQFFFNRAIKKSGLEVNVKETVHEVVYNFENQKNADMTETSNISFTDVHRDMEAVNGELSVLTTGHIAHFCPDRDFAYGSRIFVEVTYDNTELSRSLFSVRDLPTFVAGAVSDRHGIAIAGVEVHLPEPGRVTVTDNNGGFSFGFEEPAEEMLSPGRYRLVINPDLKNRAFGTLESLIFVKQGRLNNAGVLRIPLLSHDEPFRRISSRQTGTALLAGGNLEIDLSKADLIFPDGSRGSDVHVQTESIDDIPFDPVPGAVPHWMFAIQPPGVEISGPVEIVLKMPMLYGSYDYIPENGTPMILSGSDTRSKKIIPVGVGRVNDGKVISEKEVNLSTLDYVGYAFVQPEQRVLLEEYIKGTISLPIMTGKLMQGE